MPTRRRSGGTQAPLPATGAVELDRAGVWRLEAGDQAQQRRLAAAGGAEERDELAALDAELRVVDGLDRAEPLRDAVAQIIPQAM